MTNNDEKPQVIDGVEAANVSVLALCKKHGKPLRRKQRNCDTCNREANKKYRQRLKQQAHTLKRIVAAINGS